MDPGSIPHKEDQLITVGISYDSILERGKPFDQLIAELLGPTH